MKRTAFSNIPIPVYQTDTIFGNTVTSICIIITTYKPHHETCDYLLRLCLLCGAGDYPLNVLQPTKAYCTNPALVSPPSYPEALHIRRRERPLLARGVTMDKKCPIKFSLQLQLPQ
jgi:hypothetical protein